MKKSLVETTLVNPELEAQVLRALAAAGQEKFFELVDLLPPAAFPTHQAPYQTLADAFGSDQPPPADLPKADLPTGFDLDTAARELAELARKRLVAEAMERAWASIIPKPAQQVIMELQEAVARAEAAVKELSAGEVVSLADSSVAAETMRRIQEIADAVKVSGRPVPFAQTGFPTLDRLTGGLQPGWWLLAGREGMGKTFLAMCLALQFLEERDAAVMYVSMEEPAWRLRLKAVCSEAGLNWNDYASTGRGDLKAYMAASSDFDRNKGRRFAVIEGSPQLTVAAIRAKTLVFSRKVKAKKVMVVADYLQAIAHTQAGAVQEKYLQEAMRHRVDAVSQQLLHLARSQNWVVLAIVALNREGDTRESGQVNYDADVYLKLSWPPDKDPRAKQNKTSSSPDVLHLDLEVVKNRFGAAGVIPIMSLRKKNKYGEIEKSPF